MPTVRKLAPQEIETIENKGKGLRKIIADQYDRFLADYDVGDYGEAVLDEDENRLTVRNRFKAAAGRRNVGLQFLRTTGDVIRFKVIPANGDEAVETAPVSSDAPPKRRPGRPKKTAS